MNQDERLLALVAAEAHMIVRTLRPTDEGSWAVNELFIQKVLERFADALLSATVVSPVLAFQAWCERYVADRGKPLSQEEYFIAQVAFISAHPGEGPTSALAAPVVTQEGE